MTTRSLDQSPGLVYDLHIPGKQIGLAESSTDTTGFTTTTATDITGMTIDDVYVAGPIVVEFFVPKIWPTAGTTPYTIVFQLWEDGVAVNRCSKGFTNSGSDYVQEGYIRHPVTPSVGIHDYKVTVLVDSGSTFSFGGGSNKMSLSVTNR